MHYPKQPMLDVRPKRPVWGLYLPWHFGPRSGTFCSDSGSGHFDRYVGSWDSAVGHDGQSMIIQGWRKPVAMTHPFQSGVAKTIHISGKAVTSATGR
jgi:hypothetical protein